MTPTTSAKERSTQRIRDAFAAVIKEMRQKRVFSQEALAADAGYDRTYIGQVERSEKSITVITPFDLAKALGVSPVEIVKDAYKHMQ